jgi:hypothetical protein
LLGNKFAKTCLNSFLKLNIILKRLEKYPISKSTEKMAASIEITWEKVRINTNFEIGAQPLKLRLNNINSQKFHDLPPRVL